MSRCSSLRCRRRRRRRGRHRRLRRRRRRRRRRDRSPCVHAAIVSLSLSSASSTSLLSLIIIVLRLSFIEVLSCCSCGGTAVARPPRCGPCSSRGPAIQLLAPQKALVVPFVGQRERAREQTREGVRKTRRGIP